MTNRPLPKNGIVSGGRHVTTEQLARNAARAASALHELGVREGDRIALLMHNDIAYFELTRGAALLGATTVPLNWHLKPDEIDYVLRDSQAKILILHDNLLTPEILNSADGREVVVVATPPEVAAHYPVHISEELRSFLPQWELLVASQPEWSCPARPPVGAMFYTSGTTGKPKGVQRRPIPPEAVKAVQRRGAFAFGMDRPAIRSVMTGPLYHSAPHAYAMQVVERGGLLVLQSRFDPAGLLALVARHRITNLHMVPTMFVRLLALSPEERGRHDLSSLEHVVHGAAPCPPEVKRAMIDWWGPCIHEYYAMTETGFIACSSSADWLDRPGTVGRAAPGVSIAIMDPAGQELPPGETGEICVASEVTGHVAYHGAREKTEALRRGAYIGTGDVGHLDDEGYLFISDRLTDMVISGGVNIYPAEVEQALVDLPGVRDCAVFGIPHPEFGEQLVGIVEPLAGVTLDAREIAAQLRTRLASFKIPRAFEFVESLPREDSGKIRKRLLREAFIGAAAAGS